ncbi:hypothetical protein R3P38DRAFT_1193382 [Favolaschia claudopus]|uniref:Uncharacterized protein n=1 Tax=Favolaschia claudopus TaxID=2862362 RepID=A0AAW0E325_9AGAR
MSLSTTLSSSAFTRLETLRAELPNLTKTKVVNALQSLMSLPSLRNLGLTFYSVRLLPSLRFFERCSPEIRHLTLFSDGDLSDDGSRPTPCPIAETIHLTSLKVYSTKITEDHAWVERFCQALRPLALSRLKALALDSSFTSSLWHVIPKANIQALDLDTPQRGMNYSTFDLSEFSNLRFLRISGRWDNTMVSMVIPTLRTAAACERLHTVEIRTQRSKLTEAVCAEIDAVLTTLPFSALSAVTLEQAWEWDWRKDGDKICGVPFDEDLWKWFPRLGARNLFRTLKDDRLSFAARWRVGRCLCNCSFFAIVF